MTLAACAEITRKGDPDRFLAAMAAAPSAREILFPIYAFNVEVARAPWVTVEPIIAEMRLKWWRDALSEIAQGKPVRAHEVTTPLSAVLDAEGARALDGVVEARRWDIARDPFDDQTALISHLDASSGTLMWIAARTLGSCDEAVARNIGVASGLANWLRAVPALKKEKRRPLPDETPDAIATLASHGLARLRDARSARQSVGPAARAAFLAGWLAKPVLAKAARNPQAVLDGGLDPSEFARRASLLARSATGRW